MATLPVILSIAAPGPRPGRGAALLPRRLRSLGRRPFCMRRDGRLLTDHADGPRRLRGPPAPDPPLRRRGVGAPPGRGPAPRCTAQRQESPLHDRRLATLSSKSCSSPWLPVPR